MALPLTLSQNLALWSGGDKSRLAVAATVEAIAGACLRVGALISKGPLAGGLGQGTGAMSGLGEQKTLDLLANDEIAAALRAAPVAAYASEEMAEPLCLKRGAPLLVAADPIDGSSNIDSNAAIGAIFSILPAQRDKPNARDFLQSGGNQVAAGFFVFGPFTSLVLTLGEGAAIYTLDTAAKALVLTTPQVTIPDATAEFAINTSNYRHWDDGVRMYVEDCARGREGPRGKDFNMRWTASPVAEIFRILTRGGVFLYPADARPGYREGRLRIVYEANPLAFVVEQAGGSATDGRERMLDQAPSSLHQHVPFVAGSRDEVAHVARLHGDEGGIGEFSPLFLSRGLFRK